MNVNPLQSIWKQGGVAVGSYLMYSRDTATVEIAAAAGLDYVLLALEHRPQESQTVHDLCQVARLAGMAALVGPSDISPHAISHALDLGASGVVIPHVETADEVALAIEAVRYPPRGRRGRCGTAGHNLYRGGAMAEEIEHYDANVSLFLKVEAGDAIDRLDALVVPGEVDGLMGGPMDLSLNLGLPGQLDHPRVAECVDRVRAVCRDHRIHYGALVASAAGVAGAIAAGASWVTVGSEMEALGAFWKAARETVEQHGDA